MDLRISGSVCGEIRVTAIQLYIIFDTLGYKNFLAIGVPITTESVDENCANLNVLCATFVFFVSLWWVKYS